MRGRGEGQKKIFSGMATASGISTKSGYILLGEGIISGFRAIHSFSLSGEFVFGSLISADYFVPNYLRPANCADFSQEQFPFSTCYKNSIFLRKERKKITFLEIAMIKCKVTS